MVQENGISIEPQQSDCEELVGVKLSLYPN